MFARAGHDILHRRDESGERFVIERVVIRGLRDGHAVPRNVREADAEIVSLHGEVAGARLASLTSYVAKGTSTGFVSGGNAAEFYAKAPNQRTTIIHTPNGDIVRAFDGRAGNLTGTGWDDPQAPPPPSDGLYYIVRASNTCGKGTWGSTSAGAPRQVLEACP